MPRGDDVYNGIGIKNSTVSESWTLPVLPHGFHYFLDWATITVRGPSAPVLTIPSGTIVKMAFSRFEIASTTEAGGLVADDVIFTSIHDDVGGDTNGGATLPAPGNWQRLDFNAMALADSCLMRDCTFRYGGNGNGMIEANNASPRLERCTLTASATTAVYSHGAAAHPSLWYCDLSDNNQYGLHTNEGQVHVVSCCFEGNGTYGVLVDEVDAPSGSLLLSNCWWGASDGPSGEGPGGGDAVSQGVIFTPWASTAVCLSPTSVDDQDVVRVLSVEPAVPNPFNPSTVIGFALPAATEVVLDVVDLQGRRIATLAAGEMPAGRHEVSWHGRDDAGRNVSAGVYLFRLHTPDEERSGKLVLLK